MIPQCMIEAADDMAEWGAQNPATHPSLSTAIRSAMLRLTQPENRNDTANLGSCQIHHWISRQALPGAVD